jgi:hypothetical protein
LAAAGSSGGCYCCQLLPAADVLLNARPLPRKAAHAVCYLCLQGGLLRHDSRPSRRAYIMPLLLLLLLLLLFMWFPEKCCAANS